jgi:ArsR family metal-binding transcriptional regulator
LITLYPREIHINIVKDTEEADYILAWLQEAINKTWREKAGIEPSWETSSNPSMLAILKLLPRTNCRQCGETTCLVFAQHVATREKYPEDCPAFDLVNKKKLEEYLQQFFQV